MVLLDRQSLKPTQDEFFGVFLQDYYFWKLILRFRTCLLITRQKTMLDKAIQSVYLV